MRLRAVVLAALSAALLGGCSFGGDDEPTQRVNSPQLLTRAQVERYPEGSPARAFFEWWRSVQFDNPVVASRFYSRRLGLTPDKLEGQLRFGAGALHLNQRPRLVEVDEEGDTAAVLVLLESATLNPNGRVDSERVARGFNLVREDGQWKLSENMFIERGVRTQKAFAEAIQRQQSDPGN